jgi:hypothetical protein
MVVRGEAGIGKTALLDYIQGRASDCRIVRAASVEFEMEIAFAGLHLLCAPILGAVDRLPGAQRAPWYVIPADHKPTTRALVAGLVVDAVESLNLTLPEPDPEERKAQDQARRELAAEPAT